MNGSYKNKMLAVIIACALVTSVFVMLISEKEFTVGAYPPTTTPGVNDFGNATTDIEYGDIVKPTINTTGMSATTYYLYKPRYNCTSARTPESVQWYEFAIGYYDSLPITLTVSTPGQLKQISDYVEFDRAGMWIFDSGTTPTIDGTDSSTFDGFIWVNTSSEYLIDSIDDFYYGDNTSKTITVTEDGSAIACFIDLIGPDGSTILHDYYAGDANTAAGVCVFDTYLNITMAGNYTVRAYKDLDEHKYMYTYGDEEGNTGMYGYDRYYGKAFSSTLNTTLGTTNADYWDYANSGSYDPPEKNATEVIFRVRPGTPILTVQNDTRYHNFRGEVKIFISDPSGDNITDNADGTTGGSGPEYHVEVWSPDNVNITNNLTINRTNSYCTLWSSSWGMDGSYEYGRNGTYEVYIWMDSNYDRDTQGTNAEWTEEFNGTATFRITKAPGVTFEWIDDDGAYFTGSDFDGVIPSIPPVANVPLYLQFQIIGDDASFFGATSQTEAMENITLSGNALFTGTLDKIPGVSFVGSTTWKVPVIPTMSVGGSSLTITAVWEDYGSITETVDIGGTNYHTNGSVISITTPEFDIKDDQTVEITVKDASGDAYKYAYVYLFYIGETGEGGGLVDQTPIYGTKTGNTYSLEINHKEGGGTTQGVYTIGFNASQQTDNQTTVGFTAAKAPRNLTAYVYAPNAGYGYARLSMNPRAELYVHAEAVASPGTQDVLAGYEYKYFFINVTTDVNGTTYPETETADLNSMYIKILDSNGDDVTDTLFPSWDSSEIHADLRSSSPKYYVAREGSAYAIEAGEYTVYAYNNTANSRGHNSTIHVKQAQVVCDRDPFIWMSDDNISATFTITNEIDGSLLEGSLRIDNVSWKDATHNKTWANTSFDGSTDQGGNTSIELDESDGLVNGQVTVHDISAYYLPPGVSRGNITYWFKPDDSEGNPGQWARASGVTVVQVPSISISPMYVPVGEYTDVEITVTGRNEALIEDVFVELNGQGVNYQNTTSGTDGVAYFTILPNTAGNISVDVGEQGRTVDDVIIVTSWTLDVTINKNSVTEGEQFTVTVKRLSDQAPVSGAKVTYATHTETTGTDGTITFTADAVKTTTTYTITATATGYRQDPTPPTLTVIDKQKLEIVPPDSAPKGGEEFEILIANEEGQGVIGATVTITYDGETMTASSKANGVTTFTAPKLSALTEVTVTATKTGFEDADEIKFSIDKAAEVKDNGGTPGFELLTLIAALGVAFILLRRRRK